MQYEKYTFWLLLVFAVGSAYFAYQAKEKFDNVAIKFDEVVVQTDKAYNDLLGKVMPLIEATKPEDITAAVENLKNLKLPELPEWPTWAGGRGGKKKSAESTALVAAPLQYKIGR
jgi:hypothetical protein